MTRRQFEKLVRETLKALPKDIRQKLKNIDVVVEEGTGDEDVLGQYEGVSLKDRGEGYSMVLPDKITLFKRAIEAECRETRRSVRGEIRDTVLHEIAHHFGICDDRMDDLGVY